MIYKMNINNLKNHEMEYLVKKHSMKFFTFIRLKTITYINIKKNNLSFQIKINQKELFKVILNLVN